MDDSPAERKRTFSKVLLVDDSRYLADILAMFFKLDGYSSRAAYGGVEAIAAMEDEVPDIAFIDLDMPGMSGMDLARHIRASEASATILVALSGWEGEEYRKEAAAAGFDHFLTKPAAPPAIREFMQSLSGADACRDSF